MDTLMTVVGIVIALMCLGSLRNRQLGCISVVAGLLIMAGFILLAWRLGSEHAFVNSYGWLPFAGLILAALGWAGWTRKGIGRSKQGQK